MDEVKKMRVQYTLWDGGVETTIILIPEADYDALLAKYRDLEASIPVRERAAFMVGAHYGIPPADVEALLRYPDKEAK